MFIPSRGVAWIAGHLAHRILPARRPRRPVALGPALRCPGDARAVRLRGDGADARSDPAATDNEGKPAQRTKVLGGLFSTSERHSPSGPFRIAPHGDTMLRRFGLYPVVSGRLSSPEATGCGTRRPGADPQFTFG